MGTVEIGSGADGFVDKGGRRERRSEKRGERMCRRSIREWVGGMVGYVSMEEFDFETYHPREEQMRVRMSRSSRVTWR